MAKTMKKVRVEIYTIKDGMSDELMRQFDVKGSAEHVEQIGMLIEETLESGFGQERIINVENYPLSK